MPDAFTSPGKAAQSAGQGERALFAYSQKHGDLADEQSSLTDLLADLMHYACENGTVDFDLALASARLHFQAESRR